MVYELPKMQNNNKSKKIKKVCKFDEEQKDKMMNIALAADKINKFVSFFKRIKKTILILCQGALIYGIGKVLEICIKKSLSSVGITSYINWIGFCVALLICITVVFILADEFQLVYKQNKYD